MKLGTFTWRKSTPSTYGGRSAAPDKIAGEQGDAEVEETARCNSELKGMSGIGDPGQQGSHHHEDGSCPCCAVGIAGIAPTLLQLTQEIVHFQGEQVTM